jgi:hypothetical protein
MFITSVLETGNDDETVSRLIPAIVDTGDDSTPHVDDEYTSKYETIDQVIHVKYHHDVR